jgi:hypothetical protein
VLREIYTPNKSGQERNIGMEAIGCEGNFQLMVRYNESAVPEGIVVIVDMLTVKVDTNKHMWWGHVYIVNEHHDG